MPYRGRVVAASAVPSCSVHITASTCGPVVLNSRGCSELQASCSNVFIADNKVPVR